LAGKERAGGRADIIAGHLRRGTDDPDHRPHPMLIEPAVVAELALLGAVAGFLAGLLGIGGGMLMVPFVTFILSARGLAADLAVKMAIATSMATIVFTSISSVRAHHRRGAVRWDLVRTLAPGIVGGGLLSSLGVFTYVEGSHLAVCFGLFVGFSALRMVTDRKLRATRPLPGPAGQFVAGGVIGFVSGLVGAGGAFISVPFMTWCSVAIHNAVATSAALGFPIAVANVAGYVAAGLGVPGRPAASVGFVWLPALAAIAACSVLTAPLGARAAHALPVRPLQRIFAGMLSLLAAYMLWTGLR
jgi:uncharacterized membrane protein YfcA